MLGPSPLATRPKGFQIAMSRGRGGGGGCVPQTPASSSLLPSPDYYERVGQLLQALRDSEKKRLDLEHKLYEYNKSEKCRVKLKYTKLKKYLQELCESEKKARIRNQEYLKQFDHIDTHIGHFTINTEKLQELKIAVPAGINLGTTMSRGLYQPAIAFMGCQMSAISSIEDFSAEEKSSQPTKNFSIPDPHSHQQTAQSSDVTDSCVVQTTSDTQCLNKPDKIDGKTSLQIGEKTPVTASVLSEEEQTHCLEIGSNTRHSKSNLSEGKKSAELHSSLQERLSPENRTTDLKCDSSSRSEGSDGKILTREHIEVKEERASPPFSVVSVSEHCASENKWSQEKHPAWEGFSDDLAHQDPKAQRSFISMQKEQQEESSCSSDDLTVSINDDDLNLENLEPLPSPCDKVKGRDATLALRSFCTVQDRDTLPTGKNNCILQTLSSPDSEKEFSDLPKQSVQASDGGLTKAQLDNCVVTLKEGNNSLKKEATTLLKKAPAEECDHRSAIHSNESSCSLPSILNDNRGIKEAKPALRLNSVLTREQEVSSGCGDESKEENMTATVQVTGLNIGGSTFKTKTVHKITSQDSFSSSKGSPLSRHDSRRNLMTNLKSNDFWGESDDSNSEIEAALRPNIHNTSADDFDDFYDT
uniref:centrosomal protein kizuna isoform X2 n=1 Tax=Jaculus jaculus TaxID=51337 RepID=UPI001E1B330A|nr:centrosomal protein kizuna isoform X2 [Jaculus jaculus]